MPLINHYGFESDDGAKEEVITGRQHAALIGGGAGGSQTSANIRDYIRQAADYEERQLHGWEAEA